MNLHLKKFLHYGKNMTRGFKISDYDVIGFDMQNTIVEYNLPKFYQLQYDFLSNYMVEKKGYCRSVFPPELTREDADFIQRGLFVDSNRGNLLYLRNDGYIVKASHGMKILNEDVIEEVYGRDRKWSVINPFINNKLLLCSNNREIKTFLDFTDSIGVLIFAKAVEAVDINGSVNSYNVWPDVLEAMVEMIKPGSSFIKIGTNNPSEYTQPYDSTVISWLWQLKKHSKLLIISNSSPQFIKFLLPLCFGDKYFELFDIIVCDAAKPDFFYLDNRFESLNRSLESRIKLNTHNNNNIYTKGSWTKLFGLLELSLGSEPKSLYIGDNPIQDIFVPTQIPLKLDTVAVIKDFADEDLHPNYPHSYYSASKFWGPLLKSSCGFSFFGGLIKEHAKLIVPSVKVLAKYSVDQEHNL